MNNLRIALVQAAWHKDIIKKCREGFLKQIQEHGYDAERIDIIEVPGSLEIPLQAKLLALTGQYNAICCIGFITDGGVYRHEFVAQAVLNGMMQAQLDTGIPVLSAVLTPQEPFAEDGSNPKQHDFFSKHMETKGKELADSCTATIKNMEIYLKPKDCCGGHCHE